MSDERRLSPLFTWRSAIADSELRSTCKLVALTLSLHMSERGDSCFPSVATLAAEASLGVSSTREALADLHAAGWIVRDVQRGRRQSGSYASNLYTATVPGDRQLPAVSEGKSPDGGAKPPATGGEGDKTTTGKPVLLLGVREVSGKKVTVDEDALAAGILAAFNAHFETDYRGRDHVVGIIGRIRERPELTLDDHVGLIEKLGRARWWRVKDGKKLDHPTPRHIYGSGRALDAIVNAKSSADEDDDDLSIYSK